jgi:hypothetical protein
MNLDALIIIAILVVGVVAAHRERQQRIEGERFRRERRRYGTARSL